MRVAIDPGHDLLESVLRERREVVVLHRADVGEAVCGESVQFGERLVRLAELRIRPREPVVHLRCRLIAEFERVLERGNGVGVAAGFRQGGAFPEVRARVVGLGGGQRRVGGERMRPVAGLHERERGLLRGRHAGLGAPRGQSGEGEDEKGTGDRRGLDGTHVDSLPRVAPRPPLVVTRLGRRGVNGMATG